MRRTILAALLANLLMGVPAMAVDYDTIDRSIAKEPKYSGKPEYALLLFGPEARRRVWVVVDGKTIYVDRNGDGDLTAADERFAQAGDVGDIDISDPAGTSSYKLTRLGIYRDAVDPPTVMVYVDIHGGLEYQQYCDARLGATRQEAAVAHFHGPLTIGVRTVDWKVHPDTVLLTGDKPSDLYAMVGTMSARHRCWVVVVSHQGKECCFVDGVRPYASVEFPSSEPGSPPLIERYELDEFC